METQAVVEDKIVGTYDYTDEQGKLLFQVQRHEPKDFSYRRPDGRGGWIANIHGIRSALYHLPEVAAADTVLILEGEKDVDTAYRLKLPAGWAATTSPGGATKWLSEHAEMVRDKKVVICPDADPPGQRHLQQVIRNLEGKVSAIGVVRLPDGFKDLSDWAQKNKTAKQFATLLGSAVPYTSPAG